MSSHKALTGIHNYVEFKEETINARVAKMVELRESMDASKLHVKLSYGNRKTTALVPSVSLIPIADCPNCEHCKKGCYDIRNCCCYNETQKMRANNSAILHDDMERYFHEIYLQVQFLRYFRWHCGGEIISFWYWEHIVDIARRTPTCEFLVFTKMFNLVNHWLDKGNEIPGNLHVIFSDWRGLPMKNPYNLPVSSPVWKDGTMGEHVTDRQFWCPSNCAECAEAGKGCWTAGKGDTILFEAH